MAVATQNTEANVSAGKGVQGGYCFRAPVGTTLPTTPEWTPTGNDWTCMGYITEDGINFATETDSTDFNDMNGDLMDSSQNTYSESFACAFAETKAATFESIYGEDAVTDENGVISVHHKGAEPGYYTYVFMFVLKSGRKWIRFAEKAKRTSIEETTVNSSTVLSWSGTYKAVKGPTLGDYFTDLFESTETA